jgi:hypothetical protein
VSGAKRRVVFDACVPVDFRHHLHTAEVVTARFAGVQNLKNGKLLDTIEGKFDVFVTVDASLVRQQNLGNRQIAIVVVRPPSNRLNDLVAMAAAAEAAIASVSPGEVREVR